MPEDSVPDTAEPQPAVGCLLRLFWMMFGNVALLLAGMQVAASERIGGADAIYGAVVLALILARYADVTWFRGMTNQAEPATKTHLRKYVLALVAVALLGWVAARLLSMT